MEVIRDIVPNGLPVSLQIISVAILASIAYSLFAKARPWPAYPLISVRGLSPGESWPHHGKEVIEEGVKQTRGPFQIMTKWGAKIILPNRYAEEIRGLPVLNFTKGFFIDFPLNYPGYEPIKRGFIIARDTVRMKLTPSLGLITRDLVDEAIFTIDDIFGTSEEWATRQIREDMLEVVAHTSSRIFLGKRICRNQRWLEIVKTYGYQAIALSNIMHMAPAILQPLVYLVTPHAFRLRKSLRDARAIIAPEIRKYMEAVDAASMIGEKPPDGANALEWMYDLTKGKDVDFASAQLLLVVLAVDSPAQGVSRALMDICKYPDIVQQLREEIIDVIGKDGWTKTTFQRLKLMDSFLKESQRVTPLSIVSMNRYVDKEVKVSDGHTLPKGARLYVAADFENPDVYPEPGEFDVARFVKKRQEPGKENSWQLVTTSPTYLMFGHGEHACSGRFFASNQMKAILCLLLMKFDWRFLPDMPEPASLMFESLTVVAPNTKIQARRRKPEFDIDAL
ncbi:cytochrome P450 [Xylaria intraflava]|nr:cytochrome P450 [Xylaria intraflava]